jgi:hypothetical protein
MMNIILVIVAHPWHAGGPVRWPEGSADLYRVFPELGISARAGLRDALTCFWPTVI